MRVHDGESTRPRVYHLDVLNVASPAGAYTDRLVRRLTRFGNVRRHHMTRFDGLVLGCELVNPDFITVARAFGVGTNTRFFWGYAVPWSVLQNQERSTEVGLRLCHAGKPWTSLRPE